jgi:hypothetical protein
MGDIKLPWWWLVLYALVFIPFMTIYLIDRATKGKIPFLEKIMNFIEFKILRV